MNRLKESWRISECLMYLVVIFSLQTVFGVTENVQPIHGRHRRSVFTFSDMVKCATGKDPARYNGYGCYCGLGGHGEPLDDVDRCCKVHDRCYKRIRTKGPCNILWNYTVIYKHKCTKCSKSNKGCAKKLCACDSEVSLCFKKHKYNKKYKGIDKKKKCKKRKHSKTRKQSNKTET